MIVQRALTHPIIPHVVALIHSNSQLKKFEFHWRTSSLKSHHELCLLCASTSGQRTSSGQVRTVRRSTTDGLTDTTVQSSSSIMTFRCCWFSFFFFTYKTIKETLWILKKKKNRKSWSAWSTGEKNKDPENEMQEIKTHTSEPHVTLVDLHVGYYAGTYGCFQSGSNSVWTTCLH